MNPIAKSLRHFLLEYATFEERYGKHNFAKLTPADLYQYKDIIFDIIQKSYQAKGGNLKISSPNDLENLDFWIASDVDADPDPDVVIGGKTTPHGIKTTVMGQDGGKTAKYTVITKNQELMRTKGFYGETNPDMADRFNIPPITDYRLIQKVLNKEIFPLGNGEYNREIGGKMVTKVMVGYPINVPNSPSQSPKINQDNSQSTTSHQTPQPKQSPTPSSPQNSYT